MLTLSPELADEVKDQLNAAANLEDFVNNLPETSSDFDDIEEFFDELYGMLPKKNQTKKLAEKIEELVREMKSISDALNADKPEPELPFDITADKLGWAAVGVFK